MPRTVLVCILTAALGAAPAAAAVFTVGPGGTHATAQAALDAAMAAGGDNEVRVAIGTFSETLRVDAKLASGTLHLSGGWQAGFAARVLDPALTVMDAGGAGRTVHANSFAGTLVVENLTLTGGGGDSGGGVYLEPAGSGVARVRATRIVGNRCQRTAGSSEGGGVYVYARSSTTVELTGNLIAANTCRSENGSLAGVGASITVVGDARLVLAGNRIVGNRVEKSSDQITGAGVYLWAADNAVIEMSDNLVADNTAEVPAGYSLVGGGAALWIGNNARLEARSNAFFANVSSNSSPWEEHLSLIASNTSTLVFADSLVAGTPGTHATARGVRVFQRDTASVNLVNCTIAGHASTGLSGSSSAPDRLTVANSIVSGNGTDVQLFGQPVLLANLSGGDPRFVAPARRDYRLRPGSPAIGAGVVSPPGGLGVTDLAGLPRLAGGAVDQGAFTHHAAARRIPVVAHTTGFGGTPWRSTVALVNLSRAQADYDLTFASGGSTTPASTSLAAGATVAYPDVMLDPLGFPAAAKVSGAMSVNGGVDGAVIASRTFADPGAGAGTYGQFYPTLADHELLGAGETAVLPLLRSDSKFYSNIGMLNGSGAGCSGRVRLFSATGAPIGTTQTLTARAGEWAQISDIFAKAGAGTHAVASARVDVLTAGCRAWFAASVIDHTTKDPTTIPMHAPAAPGTVFWVPSVAHSSGFGGTSWRTTLAVVNAGGAAAQVQVIFRSATTEVSRTATLEAGAARSWNDVLVDLFGSDPSANLSGSLELVADQPLVVASRTYADRGAAGTYGQFFPAVTASDGLAGHTAGVLPLLRKDGSFYTNIGLQNLSRESCQVEVRLYGPGGAALGSPLTESVGSGRWEQINDAFAKAGAGSAEVAYAVVRVLDPAARVWAYASVIDATSRDPTTVPVALPWVTAPPPAATAP